MASELAAMEPRLTIVLPLKGRPLFTLRFLHHANRERVPFRILIADGEVRPPLCDMLENARAHFPNLDIEYVRYPDDTGFSRYFAKMHDALRRVRTPYVMLADNDDFLAPAGIERAADFLDAHPDYVCCGGNIAGFSVFAPPQASFGKILGRVNRLSSSYTPDSNPADVSSDNVLARVLSGFRCHWFFYSVYRARALELVWKDTAELDFSTIHVSECHGTLRTLSLGKAHRDDTITTYFKQFDTSMAGHWSTSENAPSASFAYHFLRSRFGSDLAGSLDTVARAVAEANGGKADEIAEQLRVGAEPWIEQLFRNHYGVTNRVRQRVRRLLPGLTDWLRTRRRRFVFRDKRAVTDLMRKSGAGEKYLAEFNAELARLEDAVDGKDIRAYLEHHAEAMAS